MQPASALAEPLTPAADTGAAGFTAASRRINLLAETLVRRVTGAVAEIDGINSTTRLLALNAQIEASRAGGTTGAAFGVVARAMKDLSERASSVTAGVSAETAGAIAELQHTNDLLRTEVRGTRLADLAFTNIDLIDRNLYERSCDVRWWATDSSCVDALATPSPAALQHASRRLGTILNAYTVYYDIVLCDAQGAVVANGRPVAYPSAGTIVAGERWFRSALDTASGDDFAFEPVHHSPLVAGQRVLVYSCAVREDGETHGAPLGVLGVIFNWDSLANGIIANTSLDAANRQSTRVCITDAHGLVLADSHDRALNDRISFPGREILYRQGTAHRSVRIDGRDMLAGHAFSPGYETYATGWHSLILEAL